MSSTSHERPQMRVARHEDESIDFTRRLIKLPPGVLSRDDILRLPILPAEDRISIVPGAEEDTVELRARYGIPESFVAPIETSDGRVIERQTFIFEAFTREVEARRSAGL